MVFVGILINKDCRNILEMSQNSYARLLHRADLGEGLLFPTTDVEIGDVAYFTGGTYVAFFNAFQISQAVVFPLWTWTKILEG